jgi:hypothetical protein
MNQAVGCVGVYHMERIVECQVRDAISSIRCSAEVLYLFCKNSLIHSIINSYWKLWVIVILLHQKSLIR